MTFLADKSILTGPNERVSRMSGTTCMVLSAFCLALMQAIVKFISHVPYYELNFIRSLVSALIAYGLIYAGGTSARGNNVPMLVLRAILGTISITLLYKALQILPLASAVVVYNLHPILAVALGGLILKERPSPVQVLFLLASFFGVLMVKGFDPKVSGLGIIVASLSGLAYAGGQIVIRALRNQDQPLIVVFYLGVVGSIGLGPYTYFNWVMPQGIEWWAMLAIAVLSLTGQYLFTVAYHSDRVANVAHLNYLGVVFSLFLGISIFKEIPEPLALAGIAVIVVSSTLSSRFRVRVST